VSEYWRFLQLAQQDYIQKAVGQPVLLAPSTTFPKSHIVCLTAKPTQPNEVSLLARQNPDC
jgi:hypothetical protein